MTGRNARAMLDLTALIKNRLVSEEAFRRYHAATARRVLREVEAAQGSYPTITYVDGRKHADENSVKFGGIIAYDILFVTEVIDAAYEALVAAAPVKTGNYTRNIKMFVNGVRADAAAIGRTIDVAPGDEIVFVDSVPYARKIEGNKFRATGDAKIDVLSYHHRRKRGGKIIRRPGLSAQAPDGVFEVTTKAIRARFSNYPVSVEFRYAGETGGEASGDDRWPAMSIKAIK